MLIRVNGLRNYQRHNNSKKKQDIIWSHFEEWDTEGQKINFDIMETEACLINFEMLHMCMYLCKYIYSV